MSATVDQDIAALVELRPATLTACSAPTLARWG